MAETRTTKFVFPRWANYLLPVLVVGIIGAQWYIPTVVGFALNPETLNPNYQPEQPVKYSHALHVGQLGMDCRYCHNTVEDAAFAAIPPTQTCINCHNPNEGNGIKKNSGLLAQVHESYATGMPIEWVKVHDLPDYVFFNHAAHVNNGVGCVSCHGRVDKMGDEGVHQVKTLSMAWCLDCHRSPEEHLRPREEVTNMDWVPPQGDQLAIGQELKQKYNIPGEAYMTSCSTCHR